MSSLSPPALGGWEFVNRIEVDAIQQFVVVELPQRFNRHKIVLEAMTPHVANTSQLGFRMSNDGGLTFANSTNDYIYNRDDITPQSETRILITDDNVGSNIERLGVFGEIIVYRANDATKRTTISFTGGYSGPSGVVERTAVGHRRIEEANTHLEFFWENGASDFQFARMKIYGERT